MTKIDTNEIIRLLKATNEQDQQRGFIEMMRLYSRQIYWHVRRLVVVHEDAEDIVQESFINVFRHISKFREESSLKTWLYKIATNEALRHLNRCKVETSSYDENTLLLNLFEADRQIDLESTQAKLQRAILSLPPKQRVIFNMRYYDNMEHQQIAEITGSNIVAVKSNYHYAKKSVTESLMKQMED